MYINLANNIEKKKINQSYELPGSLVSHQD